MKHKKCQVKSGRDTDDGCWETVSYLEVIPGIPSFRGLGGEDGNTQLMVWPKLELAFLCLLVAKRIIIIQKIRQNGLFGGISNSVCGRLL